MFSPKDEERILEFRRNENVFEKEREERCDKPMFIFLEGPPTANGLPHMGHVRTRAIKDVVLRYRSMRGYYVFPRIGGRDCHGLPVEVEVEKRYGIKNKREILERGLERFINECKQSVFRYKREREKMTERLGFRLDLKNAYVTMTDEYIESVRWALKKLREKGLLYKDYKVVRYCPRCGTPLSSHEVDLGYKEVVDPSIYVLFKRVDKDEYFLARTTTPRTLPSNVALAVHPDEEYVLIEYDRDGKRIRFRVADKLSEEWKKKGKVIERRLGKELEGIRYVPLFEEYKIDDERAYRVVTADFVTMDQGTGIVHIAPAHGEEDFNVSKEKDLPIHIVIDEEGKFKYGPYEGLFFKDANRRIIRDLKRAGKLLKEATIKHNYPHCRRCDTPLMAYPRETRYIRVSEFRDKLVEHNEKINRYPEHIKHGRFGNFIANARDRALSRERFRGTPLPIRKCENGHYIAVGSKKELEELAGRKLDDIELHRPYIDNVEIKCPVCGKPMKREPFVIDVRFDSGAAPFAQFHYPHENKEIAEKSMPVDFISEGVDQTRGRFYSLHTISTLLFDREAYRNVVVIGLVLDEKGRKMSKRLGNVVYALDALEKHGADALRRYMYYVTQPRKELKYSDRDVETIKRRFLDTLRNVFTFFDSYAKLDGRTPDKTTNYRTKLDRRILSRLNSVIKEVIENMDAYRITEAARILDNFVVEELSNRYVRRSRRRFRKTERDEDKLAAYNTLYEVLEKTIRLLAPFVPFITEAIYQRLVRPYGGKLSVHLEDYPEPDEALIDKDLEERMARVIDLVESVRRIRNAIKRGVRRPIKRIVVEADEYTRKAIEEFRDDIKDEVNVKAVSFEDVIPRLKVNARPRPNRIGQRYKRLTPKILKYIQEHRDEILEAMMHRKTFSFEVDGEKVELTRDDFIIEAEAPEGYAYDSGEYVHVLAELEMTPEMIREGLAREILRRIQAMRKEMNLEYTDRIIVGIEGDEEVKKAIEERRDRISSEALADDIRFEPIEGYSKDREIAGHKVRIYVKKVTGR